MIDVEKTNRFANGRIDKDNPCSPVVKRNSECRKGMVAVDELQERAWNNETRSKARLLLNHGNYASINDEFTRSVHHAL